MSFRVILADPPWRYLFANGYNRAIEKQYPTMPDDEIEALPVATLADDATALLLWATAPKLKEALGVLDAWGFHYATSAVWDKDMIGMGHWFRMQHELLLVGRRKGTRSTPVPARRSSVFREPRSITHSRKPRCVYEWIEEAWPERKVELFSRTPRPGWHVWGNEVGGDVEIRDGRFVVVNDDVGRPAWQRIKSDEPSLFDTEAA